MSAERTCGICTNDYGGAVVPTILTCCLNHVCFNCAEKDRYVQISQLTGNKKKIACMYCNQLFHSSKDTPWKVNKPFIDLSGIQVDLTTVKETQEAMQTTTSRRKSPRSRAVTTQYVNNSDDDIGSGVDSEPLGDQIRIGSQQYASSGDQGAAAEEEVETHGSAEHSRYSEEVSINDKREESGQSSHKRRRVESTDLIPAECRGVKIPSQTETASSSAKFTIQAFMTEPLFHLNPFINAKQKKNLGFGPFIHSGVATAGVGKLPSSVASRVDQLSYTQLRDKLTQALDWNSSDDGKQTATWLKYATVGSFVVMRHEYPSCQYCPERLKDENGKYIGPVYAIGVVKKTVAPGSPEEEEIANKLLKKSSCPKKYLYNFCLMEWKRMGLKNDLRAETRKYLNVICQPTLARMCNEAGKVYSSGATPRSIRQDLWEKATTLIGPDDFTDCFV